MSKPNFFIVGAPKCGTTAWVEYLKDHPDIFLSNPKEPHYFNVDFPEFRWYRDEKSYLSLFAEADKEKIVGEASVMYLYSAEAAEGIRRMSPDAKILICVRDQETFLPSYHNQLLYSQHETETSFEAAWRLSLSDKPRAVPKTCKEATFLDYAKVGAFDEQVARFCKAFRPEQIKILSFEKWLSDPREAYLEMLDFLGVPDDKRIDFPKVNSAKYHKSRSLARLTQRPPEGILSLARALRRVMGKDRLALAGRIRSMNSARGYLSEPISDDLKCEIRNFFGPSNARLKELIDATA